MFFKLALNVTLVMLLALWHGCAHAQVLCPWHRATKHTRSVFRFYWFATMIAGGIAFTYLTVDQRQVRNLWYNRPDLKPFPAMVAKDDLDITE